MRLLARHRERVMQLCARMIEEAVVARILEDREYKQVRLSVDRKTFERMDAQTRRRRRCCAEGPLVCGLTLKRRERMTCIV